GTYFEEEIADSLGIPFLPFCPPVLRHPFVQQPLMGYRGSSLLADALEDALRRPQQEQSEEENAPPTGPSVDR
ncbi:MAG: hypothetical protein M3Q54_08485, partial [Actinomycetota bacterium]|nr:hypothetical protein [Actinomycetota bacterium]